MPSSADVFLRISHRLRDHRLYRRNPSFGNPPWNEASQRVLILRLSCFADVDRSTPHLFLADEIRRLSEDAYIDMAFLPCRDDARVLGDCGLPLILGTQSHRVLEDFDLLLVSNSYILELANLPWLLVHSGVPVWAGQRDERWPPIVLGGSNASAAHAIVREDGDCMADAIFFGEGEGAVGAIARSFRQRSGLPKKTVVAETAAEVQGLWPAGDLAAHREKGVRTADRGVRTADRGVRIADKGARTADAAVRAAEAGQTLSWSAPVLPGPQAGTARLSITLGCPCLCSFCFEGHDRRPYREIPAAALIEQARALKRATGADTLELASFTFNAHSGLAALLPALHRIYHRVSLMSQRADILARSPGLLDLEIAADKRSFSFGIEGISARQRRFLHKSLEEADIRAALEGIHSRRTRELKLFYILTGREEESDFAELSAFVKWLKQVRRGAQAAPRLVFSFGLLVRMPFTPLRYDAPLLSEDAWRPLIRRARSICETGGFEFRLSQQWPAYAATQALALGDYSLNRLLLEIAARGCVTAEGLPPGADRDVDAWIGGHAGELLAEKPKDCPFAFSFLETGNGRSALYAQYQRALEGRDAGRAQSRAGARGTKGAAADCRASARALAALTGKKHRLKPLFVKARLPREAAGLGREWGEAWLMRRLLESEPLLLDNVLAVRECIMEQSGVFGPDAAWFGWTVAGITAWDAEDVERALEQLPGIFGEAVPGFVPGTFSSLSVRLDLGPLFPDPLDRLAWFLREAHAPATLMRDAAGLSLVPAARSLRKRMLLEGHAEPGGEGWRLELRVGPKLRIGDFLDSFAAPGTAGTARTAVIEVSEVSPLAPDASGRLPAGSAPAPRRPAASSPRCSS